MAPMSKAAGAWSTSEIGEPIVTDHERDLTVEHDPHLSPPSWTCSGGAWPATSSNSITLRAPPVAALGTRIRVRPPRNQKDSCALHQQRGLADPGLTPHHDRSATLADATDETLRLELAPEQWRCG